MSVVVSCLDDLDICFSYCWLLSKLLTKEVGNEVKIAAEQPAHKTERKHIAALQHCLIVHASLCQCILDHLSDRTLDDTVWVDAHLAKIVGCLKLCLLQILRSEGISINYDRSLWLSKLILCLKRSSIHRHENITLVARSEHLTLAYMHLKT